MSLAVGKRRNFEKSKEWKPHNLSNVFLGTALLWFGWIGFNGGSAIAGTSRAAMAATGIVEIYKICYGIMLHHQVFVSVTCIAAASAGMTWAMIDFRYEKKISGLAFCSGVVSGLVGITPGSGFVAPWAAILIGCFTAVFCNLGCKLKHALGFDDSLDVFGVHGLGGFLGNILTGMRVKI